MPSKAHVKSANAAISGIKTLKSVTNKTWNSANKAPMFTKKSTDKKTGKKVTIRTKRLINSHAYAVLASGAAGWLQSVLQREAKAFRTQVDNESVQAPWLPRFSKGAKALLEQWLCAYAQDATRNAVSIREGLKTTKRLNGSLMKLGFAQTNENVFQRTLPVPRNLMICDKPKKTVNKDGKKVIAEDGDAKEPTA